MCRLQTKDANSPPEVQEEREAVDFTGPVDSVYLDAPGYVELDVGTGECVVHRPPRRCAASARARPLFGQRCQSADQRVQLEVAVSVVTVLLRHGL